MISAIIESVAGMLAEHFATKATQAGMRRAGKAQGWIALGVLLALFALVIYLGVFLTSVGVWPVSILMFAIAALLAYIMAVAVVRGVRGRR